ncbi:serine hydrolase [Solicola sp. PLA-1-18]|uniref:serine hydrolase n=1 Tax=Solicola sp. PLA-1-18 TaxID=3380532 RepID=UPI003B7ABE16
MSVWAGPVDGPALLARDADAVHHAASTLKLPLLVAVLSATQTGRIDLDDEIEVHADFASAVPGATFASTPAYDNDAEPWALLGGRASVGWLARRSVVRSSNLATNLLLEQVGPSAVDEVWRRAGASRSSIRKGIEDGPAREAGLTNDVTARDLASVVGALAAGRLLDPAHTAWATGVLGEVEHVDGLPAGLPRGTPVWHKPGWIEGSCHDVGLVTPPDGPPLVVAVLTTGPFDDEAGHRLVADVSRACWDHRPRS